MKWMAVSIVIWLALVSPVFTDEAADREQIAAVIEDSIAWFKTKNFDRLFEIFPEDPDLFMFQPNSKETVIGGQAFREGAAQWRAPENVYLRHEIRDLRLKMSQSGTVAWWSAVLDDCGSYGGQEFCWKDCRWTGVVEKRAGKWVIAQAHFSFAKDKVLEEMQAAENAAPEEFSDYAPMRKRLGEFFAQKKYAAGAALLKAHLDKFPDNLMANVTNLALMALLQNDHEKTIYWLEEGHQRGLFFNKWAFLGEIWKPVNDLPRFMAFVKENETRIALAQEKAKMKLELVKPDGYNPKRKYPLFIALHGGGENIEDFKPHWTSPKLQKQFIVAYVQSSQVADMKGFHWQDDVITQKELAAAFTQIKAQVSIDPRHIYIGGFSSGGYGSMVALFSGIIPARGFVVLCPELPADPSAEVLRTLRSNKVAGTLLTNEQDGRVERQKAFVKYLSDAKIKVRFLVTPNIGHWYPENLSQLIDEALKHMVR